MCWRSCGIHVGFVMARLRAITVQAFPAVLLLRGSKKMRFSLLSKFLLTRLQTRANVFYNGKDLSDSAVIPFHEMRAVDETVRAAMMNLI